MGDDSRATWLLPVTGICSTDVVPLGNTLAVPRGTAVSLAVDIQPATTPDWSQFVPPLAGLDVVQGVVTGPREARVACTGETSSPTPCGVDHA